MKSQVLEFTSAFPPAQKAIQTLWEIEYVKHLNSFMDSVQFVCEFVYALFIITSDVFQTWYRNGGKELMIEGYNRLQFAMLWFTEIAIPATVNFAENTYEFGVNVRYAYNTVTSRQFVNLD